MFLATCAGTSDEHISVVQYLKTSHVDGAIIVTTPQEVSIIDVRKEINFCKKVSEDLPTQSCVAAASHPDIKTLDLWADGVIRAGQSDEFSLEKS